MASLHIKGFRQRGRRVLALGLSISCITGLLVTAQPAGADSPAPLPGTVPVAGAVIIGEQQLTQRTVQLTVATPSFTSPTQVEVILPAGYGADSSRSWPVTYYTHGTNHTESTFRAEYNGEAATASFPSIVVSPRGDSGYWSDWFNSGTGGPPEYETFVIEQLIPLIDANFRTLPERAYRAVMGESMGGYGSLMLAARHPDKFAAAASLSGAVDSNWVVGASAISASSVLQLTPPDSIYGPRATEAIRWRGHNPTDLATNLGTLDLQIITGNGVLDPTRETGTLDAAGCSLESGAIQPESVSLHQTLLNLGIPHAWEELSWGCHTTALFYYETTKAIKRFESVFAQPVANPASFDYRSIKPEFDIYGWHLAADQSRALEFLNLKDVTDSGLTITGSGTTTITSPPLFTGAKPVTVTVNGESTSVRPDGLGRITFKVNQGIANAGQQYSLGATTNRTTSVVTITR